MFFRYATLPIFVIILGTSFSLTAMDGDQKNDQLTQTLQGVRGNEFDGSFVQPHSNKTKTKAFRYNLPDDTKILSNYLEKDSLDAGGLLDALVNTDLIVKTTIKVAGNSTEITNEYELDVRPLERFFKAGILAKESKEIDENARKSERDKLYIFQRHPGKLAVACLAIGFSLPYVVPLLAEKYNSLEQ